MTKLSDATRDKLKSVSTATVATALFKRGFRIQMIQDVHPLGPAQPVLVGEAFTLRYMPAREDLNKIDVFRDRAHPQRKAIEDCPVRGACHGQPQGCPCGLHSAILVTRLMKRGCAASSRRRFRDSLKSQNLAPPIATLSADQPTPSGDRDQRPDRLRRRAVFPGDVIRRQRWRDRIPPICRRNRRETVEMTFRFHYRAGPERPLDPRPYPPTGPQTEDLQRNGKKDSMHSPDAAQHAVMPLRAHLYRASGSRLCGAA